MRLISVITPCFNEEGNVREMYEAVKAVFAGLPQYRYEHIFIDNGSKDRTAIILREIAAQDRNVKVILNTRNFGHVRSGYYALLQARGDAVISLACDFQDPPELIPEFLRRWEAGLEGRRRREGVGRRERPLLRPARPLLPDARAHRGHRARAAVHRLRPATTSR